MSSSKPLVIIIPGGWHVPASYEALTKALESETWERELETKKPESGKLSFEVKIPELPSVSDTRPPVADLSTDTATVREFVSKFIDEGREVIVVCHSYGGQVGSNALYDLGQKKKGEPGVSNLVYVAASILPEKGSMMGQVAEWNHGHRMPAFTLEEDGSITVTNPRLLLFNDDSSENVDAALKTFKLFNSKCMADEIENAAWRTIPTTYIYTSKDWTLPVEYQRLMVKRVRDAGTEVKTAELDTGHGFFATMQWELAEIVQKIAQGEFKQGDEVSFQPRVEWKHPYDPQEP